MVWFLCVSFPGYSFFNDTEETKATIKDCKWSSSSCPGLCHGCVGARGLDGAFTATLEVGD